MKAIELRLGNYVMNLEREIDRITGISDPLIATEKIPGDIDAWVDPIPLTEEWLKKFGFVQRDNYYWHNWGTNGVEFIFKDLHYKGFEIQLGKAKYKYIEYVHQLQNLYYILTGEELEII